MKKRILLVMMILLLVSCSSKSKELDIVVASDLHFISQKLTDNGPFFEALTASADGKNMLVIDPISDAFIDEMLLRKPDVVILSGDLTFNGEKQSHEDLAEKLAKLKKEKIAVYVIPGNHDVNYPYANRYFDTSYEKVDATYEADFTSIYEQFGYRQADKIDPYSNSYLIKETKDLWILMIDTNSKNINSIDDRSIDWIEEILKEAQKQHVSVLSVTHQNILEHSPMFTSGYQIEGAEKLWALYQHYPVLVNLSGHMHIQHIQRNGDVSEILTSALSILNNSYGALHFDGKKLTYQCENLDVEKWAVQHQIENERCIDFADKAKEFFNYAMNYRMLQNYAELNEEILQQMSTTLTDFNVAYFSGRPLNLDDYQNGIEYWREHSKDFTLMYIESILDEINGTVDHLCWEGSCYD